MSRVYNYAFGSGSLLGPEPNPLNLNLWSGSRFSDFLDRTECSGLSSSKSSKNWTDSDHGITMPVVLIGVIAIRNCNTEK